MSTANIENLFKVKDLSKTFLRLFLSACIILLLFFRGGLKITSHQDFLLRLLRGVKRYAYFSSSILFFNPSIQSKQMASSTDSL